MKMHAVKSWPRFFEQICSGTRTHELRRNDRDYQIGDRIELNEYDPAIGAYTGRTCTVVVTSITSASSPCAASEEALRSDFCIMSVKRQ
jgi:hypothetical protein